MSVNCYGPKREPKLDERSLLNQPPVRVDNSEIEAKMAEIKEKVDVDNLSLQPWSKNVWSEFFLLKI